MIFRKWGGGIKGRLELFQKFIRFGRAALPLEPRRREGHYRWHSASQSLHKWSSQFSHCSETLRILCLIMVKFLFVEGDCCLSAIEGNSPFPVFCAAANGQKKRAGARQRSWTYNQTNLIKQLNSWTVDPYFWRPRTDGRTDKGVPSVKCDKLYLLGVFLCVLNCFSV